MSRYFALYLCIAMHAPRGTADTATVGMYEHAGGSAAGADDARAAGAAGGSAAGAAAGAIRDDSDDEMPLSLDSSYSGPYDTAVVNAGAGGSAAGDVAEVSMHTTTFEMNHIVGLILSGRLICADGPISGLVMHGNQLYRINDAGQLAVLSTPENAGRLCWQAGAADASDECAGGAGAAGGSAAYGAAGGSAVAGADASDAHAGTDAAGSGAAVYGAAAGDTSAAMASGNWSGGGAAGGAAGSLDDEGAAAGAAASAASYAGTDAAGGCAESTAAVAGAAGAAGGSAADAVDAQTVETDKARSDIQAGYELHQKLLQGLAEGSELDSRAQQKLQQWLIQEFGYHAGTPHPKHPSNSSLAAHYAQYQAMKKPAVERPPLALPVAALGQALGLEQAAFGSEQTALPLLEPELAIEPNKPRPLALPLLPLLPAFNATPITTFDEQAALSARCRIVEGMDHVQAQQLWTDIGRELSPDAMKSILYNIIGKHLELGKLIKSDTTQAPLSYPAQAEVVTFPVPGA